MTNKELIKLTKKVLSDFEKLQYITNNNDLYFKKVEILKPLFIKYIQMGAANLMTKKQLFKIVQFQSSLRPFAEHKFYIHFLNK